MDDHLQRMSRQTAATMELFHDILDSFSKLQAENDNVSQRIAHIHASILEYDRQRSTLGQEKAFASRQDSVNGDAQYQCDTDTNESEQEEWSSLAANKSKRGRTRKLSYVDVDQHIDCPSEPSIVEQTDHCPLLSLQIQDDTRSQACKLVDQVMLGKELLDPTDNCDAKTWLLNLTEALFERGTAIRPTRRCLELIAAILDPSTFTHLKNFDEVVQAGDKAEEDAMLFCIQLFASHSESGKADNVPIVETGIASTIVASIDQSLATKKAKRAALKDKILQKAIEDGQKLSILCHYFGQGIIHVFSVDTCFLLLPEITVDSVVCICESTQAFLPDFYRIFTGLVRRSEPVVSHLEGQNQSKIFWFEGNDDSLIANRECSMQKLLDTMENPVDACIE